MDTGELLRALFRSKSFARTMDLRLGRGHGPAQLLVVFSVDGAKLHSSSDGVFGFLRVLNQVEFAESTLMQATVMLAQCNESR